MMMKFAAVLVAVACLVASPVRADAPVARALLDSKTIFLARDGGGEGTFNDLADAFRTWGRYEVVDDPAAADLIGTLGGFIPYRGWSLTITKHGDPTQLWKGRASKGILTNVADGLVERFRKYVDHKK